jgi:hypothetical protein
MNSPDFRRQQVNPQVSRARKNGGKICDTNNQQGGVAKHVAFLYIHTKCKKHNLATLNRYLFYVAANAKQLHIIVLITVNEMSITVENKEKCISYFGCI